ncbi:hypothetical protein ANANG_G00078770, partial [Anguilla anguilla]
QRSSSSVSLRSSQAATELAWARCLRKWPLGTCQPWRSGGAEPTVLERPRLVAMAASKRDASGDSRWRRSLDRPRSRSPCCLWSPLDPVGARHERLKLNVQYRHNPAATSSYRQWEALIGEIYRADPAL